MKQIQADSWRAYKTESHTIESTSGVHEFTVKPPSECGGDLTLINQQTLQKGPTTNYRPIILGSKTQAHF